MPRRQKIVPPRPTALETLNALGYQATLGQRDEMVYVDVRGMLPRSNQPVIVRVLSTPYSADFGFERDMFDVLINVLREARVRPFTTEELDTLEEIRRQREAV